MPKALNIKVKKEKYGSLYGSSPIYFIRKLTKKYKNLIVLLDNNTEINNFFDEFQLFKTDEIKINKFLDVESLPYENTIMNNDINSERIKTFYNLINFKQNLIIASFSSVMKRLVPINSLKNNFIKIDLTKNYDFLIQKLSEYNYQRTSEVQEKGEFSVRGPIIDVFSAIMDGPVRIIFDKNKIDGIREFNIVNQKSFKNIDNFLLSTKNEINLDNNSILLYKNNSKLNFDEGYLEDVEFNKITNKILYPTIFNVLPLFYKSTSTFFDFFENTHTAIISGKDISSQFKDIESFYKKYYKRFNEEKYILAPNKLVLKRNEYEKALLNFNLIELSTYKIPKETYSQNLSIKKLPSLQISNSFKDPYSKLKNFLATTTYKVLICIKRESLQNNIKKIFKELNFSYDSIVSFNEFIHTKKKIAISRIPIFDGFIDDSERLAVISDRDIFGARSVSQPKSSSKKNVLDEYISDISSLKLESPVVHDAYGVGRYKGLINMNIEGIQTELMKIEYADEDILYIPVTSMNLIKKYAGYTGLNIPLHKLGTNQWIKIKNRAKKKINDIAVELLEVQSKRLSNKGIVFNTNFHEFKVFCNKFPFVETEDQFKAINEVLSDMSSDRPMDRLICGDVGFGKTEIIMRAAFIASLNEKKTIILAPTTILVEQHYRTFLKRFENTPIIIKKLSRLQTPAQRKRILELFSLNKIDILIGTHALLSNPNYFKDIGLLIIDEEHKFGVAAKEKIKKVKSNIDIITLTATPIPRTLNIALSQIKDLSIIETPPENRKSISTLILKWDENIIADAIEREIQRGGQVYFVHNEIRTIKNEIDKINNLDKNLRTGVIHGRLSNKEIEIVMNDFLENKIDILLCTSIIESGLDIQNVNTIIINNANKFGLSQLHQIRGRVGRTTRQAYAYLVINETTPITLDAKKRLEAIDSIDSLGGGLELATHDLEIRGAGELLGEEQSGQVYEVGYAMFTEMLSQSIHFLKTGSFVNENEEFELDINIPALIPHDYMSDIFTRLQYYKRISSQRESNGVNEIKNELIDRFGPIPPYLDNLFRLTILKIQISQYGVNYLKITDKFIRIKFKDINKLNFKKSLSCYKGDENLKIYKDGLVQYKKEFDDFITQCQFIQNLSSNFI